MITVGDHAKGCFDLEQESTEPGVWEEGHQITHGSSSHNSGT